MSASQNFTQALLSAVKSNNFAKAKKILNAHGCPTDNDYSDYKILIQAVQTRDLNMVRLLLDHGCRVKISSKTNEYCTPLYYAVENNDIQIMKELLAKGASVTNTDLNKDSPLFLAMKKRHWEAVDMMLLNYSTKNIDVTKSHTQMHFNIVCMRNHVGLARIFIAKGIDVTAARTVELKQFGSVQYTPLHYAVQYESIDIIALLLKHGANHSFDVPDNSLSPIHYAFYKNPDFFEKSKVKDKYEKMIGLLFNAHQFDKLINPTDKNGVSHFHVACSCKSVRQEIIKKFLKLGVDVNKPINHDSTLLKLYAPLHLAVKYDLKETVEVLLEHQANINSKADQNFSPLQIAFACKNLSMIKLLCKYNPDICEKDQNDNTLLNKIFISKQPDYQLVDSIVSAHQVFAMNPVNKSGLSHFHIACATDQIKIVAKFLQHGVDVNASVSENSKQWAGFTALHFAAAHHRLDVVKLLVKCHADMHITDVKGKTPLMTACEVEIRGGSALARDAFQYMDDKRKLENEQIRKVKASQSKKFLLTKSKEYEEEDANFRYEYKDFLKLQEVFAENRQIRTIKFLLEKGSDINLKDKAGSPQLFYLGIFNMKEYLIEIFKQCQSIPPEMVQLITILLCQNHKRVIQVLLEHGADINSCIPNRVTLLHLLASKENPFEKDLDVCELFLQKGANPNARDKLGNTPLLLSIEKGSVEFIELLLKYKADANCPTLQKLKTPLHVAALYSTVNDIGFAPEYNKIINLLISHGADVEKRDEKGQSPIFVAAGREQSSDALRCLLKASCNVNARDRKGRTPLFYALRFGNFPGMRMLLNKGADINICDNKNTSLMKHFYKIHKMSAMMDVSNPYREAFKIAETHIERILLIDHFVSQENKQYCRKMSYHFEKQNVSEILGKKCSDDDDSNCDDDIGKESSKSKFVQMFEKELIFMKKIKIDSFTSLYDILFKNSWEMVYYVANELLSDYLKRNIFRAKIPAYGYILDLKYSEGMKRLALFKSAEQSLQLLTGSVVSNTCHRQIFLYLNNDDLNNLIAIRTCDA